MLCYWTGQPPKLIDIFSIDYTVYFCSIYNHLVIVLETINNNKE